MTALTWGGASWDEAFPRTETCNLLLYNGTGQHVSETVQCHNVSKAVEMTILCAVLLWCSVNVAGTASVLSLRILAINSRYFVLNFKRVYTLEMQFHVLFSG